ncbi:TerB family tellurite resistance protein [Chitinivorax sp. B]|uniref:TerB family tellurite resistance protein n=1 Tax=Chitinivorax sp. B TaxID=2502235 RepID=UPI0010F72113|nr:TerB family tellurite resistance protein [Chitinivorax sp. B]
MISTMNIELNINHVQLLVRAMHELSLVDGVHDAERVMLNGFYQACQADSQALTTFQELVSVKLDLSALADNFNTPELKRAFLHSCLLLAYADGQYSTTERARIVEYGKALGMMENELAVVEDQVADHLLQQISRIENVAALGEVAAGMHPGKV